jgi:hypothetical protein
MGCSASHSPHSDAVASWSLAVSKHPRSRLKALRCSAAIVNEKLTDDVLSDLYLEEHVIAFLQSLQPALLQLQQWKKHHPPADPESCRDLLCLCNEVKYMRDVLKLRRPRVFQATCDIEQSRSRFATTKPQAAHIATNGLALIVKLRVREVMDSSVTELEARLCDNHKTGSLTSSISSAAASDFKFDSQQTPIASVTPRTIDERISNSLSHSDSQNDEDKFVISIPYNKVGNIVFLAPQSSSDQTSRECRPSIKDRFTPTTTPTSSPVQSGRKHSGSDRKESEASGCQSTKTSVVTRLAPPMQSAASSQRTNKSHHVPPPPPPSPPSPRTPYGSPNVSNRRSFDDSPRLRSMYSRSRSQSLSQSQSQTRLTHKPDTLDSYSLEVSHPSISSFVDVSVNYLQFISSPDESKEYDDDGDGDTHSDFGFFDIDN